MESIKIVIFLTWILLQVFALCQSINTTSSNGSADMITILETAISGNTALRLHKEVPLNLHKGTPMLGMTLSKWSSRGSHKENTTENVVDSIPLPSVSSAEHSSSTQRKNLNISSSENELEANQSLNESNKINFTTVAESNNEIVLKTNSSKAGFYIPIEKLSRLKRQTRNTSSSDTTKKRPRVLFLMNRKTSNNTQNAQKLFPGKVLMLVKKPNASAIQQTNGFRSSKKEIVYTPQTGDPKIDEATQSQPAIQKISDLHKIELPLIPLEFTTENGSMDSTQRLNNQHSLSQVQRISRNSTSIEEIGHTPSLLDNSQSVGELSMTSNLKQLIRNRPVVVISQAGSNRLANVPVERQLIIQPAVSSNRRAIHPSRTSNRRTATTGSRPTRPSSRPLVRAVSSRTLNQQRRGRRIISPQIRQTRRQVPRQRPRQTQAIQRRTPNRRQVVRRRQLPPDPFTRRFSAGFQRGSNLLHQPPLELTSFSGSRFNTLTPEQTRLPPFSPPIGMFGGIGVPGLFPGPSIL